MLKNRTSSLSFRRAAAMFAHSSQSICTAENRSALKWKTPRFHTAKKKEKKKSVTGISTWERTSKPHDN